MRDRYSRAARLTAPKVAAATAGTAVSGYWLDDGVYFFTSERFDPKAERVRTVPSIADFRTRRVHEAASLEWLSEVTGEDLTFAAFDMPVIGRLSVSTADHVYLVDLVDGRVLEKQAVGDERALYSPDGRHAVVVRENDLWVRDHSSGAEKPLTTGGRPHQRYGQQPETCLAAISYRKRPAPMGLWSPDSQWFFTHLIDESGLPDLIVVEHVPPGGGRPAQHRFKYSMPGDPLPMLTLVAVNVASGEMVAFPQWQAPVMTYSPFYLRMAWAAEDGIGWFVRFDRYRRSVELIQLDFAKRTGRVVVAESVESGYIDLNPMYFRTPNIRTLAKSREVMWFSERDGRGHLYLYDASTGSLKNRITRGEWVVRDIVHVDGVGRRMLFLAGGVDANRDPVRRSLCSINLDGTGFEVLCSHDGDVFVPPTEPCGLGQDRLHRASYKPPGVSPDGCYAVVRYASAVSGNSTAILDVRTNERLPLASSEAAREEPSLRQFSFTAADGVTRLYGMMFLPSDFDESHRYPLVDYIYPGPQVTHQPQSFRSTNSSQAAALAELGFVTIMLDTRGMPGRDRAFHQLGYGSLLEPQLSDHAAAVAQLCSRHAFIDPARVGIFGWSAGGAATVRALCDYGSTFKVGVAVCGSHDSSLYAAGWSDRYRGPGDSDLWARQANASVVHKLQGKLLLVSGDMDENVHVSQTLTLVNALIEADRDFDLLIVPNAGHDVLMTSPYVQRRMWDYFVRQLLGETPPEGWSMRFDPEDLRRCAARAERELKE